MIRKGDFIRVRDLNHRDTSGKQIGYRPDSSKNKEDKQVFVCLVLGTEPLHIDDEMNSGKNLDPEEALHELGWSRSGEAEDPEESDDGDEDEKPTPARKPIIKASKKRVH
jgi:hypothetical protein